MRWGVHGVAALGLGWLLRQRRYQALAFFAGAVGATVARNLLAKYHFDRLRPDFCHWVSFEGSTLLPDPSFPSGHTLAGLAGAGPHGGHRLLAHAWALGGAHSPRYRLKLGQPQKATLAHRSLLLNHSMFSHLL